MDDAGGPIQALKIGTPEWWAFVQSPAGQDALRREIELIESSPYAAEEIAWCVGVAPDDDEPPYDWGEPEA